MAVAVGVGALVVAAAGTYVSVNNADHAEDAAKTGAANAQANVNNQIAAAEQQKVNAQNAQANATQVAQSRVRAISNPDGDTIMTSPLGTVGPKAPAVPGPGQTNLQAPQATPGMVTTPGKATIGG